MIDHGEILLKKHLIKMNTLRIKRQDKQMIKIFEQREKLDYGAQIILYEDTIREAASVARSYMLNSSGLDDSYVGTVGVEQVILKHFGLEKVL